MNVGEPFSAKQFLGPALKQTFHPLRPIEPQYITPEQNHLIQHLSHEIVYRQQQGAIITTFQIVAVALTMSLHNTVPLTEETLTENIIWLSRVFKRLGATVFDYDEESIKKEMKETLLIHNNLIKMDKGNRLRLLNNAPFLMTDEIKKRMKGL